MTSSSIPDRTMRAWRASRNSFALMPRCGEEAGGDRGAEWSGRGDVVVVAVVAVGGRATPAAARVGLCCRGGETGLVIAAASLPSRSLSLLQLHPELLHSLEAGSLKRDMARVGECFVFFVCVCVTLSTKSSSSSSSVSKVPPAPFQISPRAPPAACPSFRARRGGKST